MLLDTSAYKLLEGNLQKFLESLFGKLQFRIKVRIILVLDTVFLAEVAVQFIASNDTYQFEVPRALKTVG